MDATDHPAARTTRSARTDAVHAWRTSLATGLAIGIVCGGAFGWICGSMLSNSYGYRLYGNPTPNRPAGVPGNPPGRVFGTNEGPGVKGNGRLTGDEVRKTTPNGLGTPVYGNDPSAGRGLTKPNPPPPR
jgi:hypothetical protein